MNEAQVGRSVKCLSLQEWRPLRNQHKAEVRKWTEPCRQRRACDESHPVHDFLFTYYSYPMGRLERWHAGLGYCYEFPESKGWEKVFAPRDYVWEEGIVHLREERLNEYRRQRLSWMLELLEATSNRAPHFGCYGLHEWAMVYRAKEIRHRETSQLRLPQEQVDELVRSRKLCCTHFDAFRFFVPETQPMNHCQPSLESRQDLEQPGCLHANMDLYKWAYKALPWIPSELVWRCFELALKGREIDMRASPYELSAYGYEPIKIETPEGRVEYEKCQRELSAAASVLRLELIEALRLVIGW